jgi:hypothetical protein
VGETGSWRGEDALDQNKYQKSSRNHNSVTIIKLKDCGDATDFFSGEPANLEAAACLETYAWELGLGGWGAHENQLGGIGGCLDSVYSRLKS